MVWARYDHLRLMYIQLEKSTSRYFTIHNSVRQGGTLFSKLFAVYIDNFVYGYTVLAGK